MTPHMDDEYRLRRLIRKARFFLVVDETVLLQPVPRIVSWHCNRGHSLHFLRIWIEYGTALRHI
jgi:hypothetical protein